VPDSFRSELAVAVVAIMEKAATVTTTKFIVQWRSNIATYLSRYYCHEWTFYGRQICGLGCYYFYPWNSKISHGFVRYAAWRHGYENPCAVIGRKADMSVYRIGMKYEFWSTSSTNKWVRANAYLDCRNDVQKGSCWTLCWMSVGMMWTSYCMHLFHTRDHVCWTKLQVAESFLRTLLTIVNLRE
jgi:hypothetical protein